MSRRVACVSVAAAMAAVLWCTGCADLRARGRRAEAEAEAALPRQVKGAKDGSVGLLVPSGEFLMGVGEQQRRVVLGAYYIDRTEVTNAQYARFLAEVDKAGDAPWRHPAQPKAKKGHTPALWDNAQLGKAKADHPVVGVDWFDAYAYAKWAGKRLPTEAEWERAARGADGRTYPWGEAPPEKRLRYRANFFSTFLAADRYHYTAPVGTFPTGASPVGCLNMAGNAAEWCADWHGPLPEARRIENPTGPATGAERAIRGGAWNLDASSLCTYGRWRMDPAKRLSHVGFRCASDAVAPAPAR